MRILRVLEACANGFTFFLMLILSMCVAPTNKVLALLFVLSAIDCFTDVYYIFTGKFLIPMDRTLYRVLNFIFEMISFIVALSLAYLSYVYLQYFEVPFWIGMLISSCVLIISAIEDMKMLYIRKKSILGVEVRRDRYVTVK